MSFLKKMKGMTNEFKDMNMGGLGKYSTGSDATSRIRPNSAENDQPNQGTVHSFYNKATVGVQQHQSQYVQSAQQYSHNQGYNQPRYAQQNQYGGPAQSPGSPLPPGWVQQWDQNSQRYYYLEQSTGRSQWEPPVDHNRGSEGFPPGQGYPPYQGQSYNQQSYGHEQVSHQADQSYPPTQGQNYNQQTYGYDQADKQKGQSYPPPVAVAHPGGPNYPTEATKGDKTKKSDSHVDAMAAGAGGLILGALAGAAMQKHHDKEKYGQHSTATSEEYISPPKESHGFLSSFGRKTSRGSSSVATQGSSYHTSHASSHGGGPAVIVIQEGEHSDSESASAKPDDELVEAGEALEQNSDVASSERSSLEEAREDYEEAQKEAEDSDASSSDKEEAEEAKEEYEAEIEEAQEEQEEEQEEQEEEEQEEQEEEEQEEEEEEEEEEAEEEEYKASENSREK